MMIYIYILYTHIILIDIYIYIIYKYNRVGVLLPGIQNLIWYDLEIMEEEHYISPVHSMIPQHALYSLYIVRMSQVLCKELQAFGQTWPMTIQVYEVYIDMLWNWDRTQDVVRTHQTFETMKETQISRSFLELGCPRTVVQLNCHTQLDSGTYGSRCRACVLTTLWM
jgi:hypothetical protein